MQVLLEIAGPQTETQQRGPAEERPPRQRVLGQHAVRQLRARPAADGEMTA